MPQSWNLKYNRKKNESLWSALLVSRAIENPGEFFSDANYADLYDPFLFEQMAKSVERIKKAIVLRERILIYGDYDVDGTSGASLLIHTLRFLGAEVSYRVPHRLNEGYGLHMNYIEEAKKNSVAIIITVDCGISCKKEIDQAESLGINVIITDHHTVPIAVPSAFATLHPLLSNYPFKHLSGSGVAFKLAQALLNDEKMTMTLIDLASLGTVADCVPLIGENRAIVKMGLKQIAKTKWDGLKAILESSGNLYAKEFTTDTIGFQIGPRINAAGRMDTPYWAIQTLLASGELARQKAKKLEELNRDRQTLTTKIFEEALLKINPEDSIIIAEGEGWSSGLVGLIAGKIQEKFSKPTLILDDRGDFLVGSARSVTGFNIVEAITKAAHVLEHFGGHEMAAGFNLKKENYLAFKKILIDYTSANLTNNTTSFELETELFADDLNLENVDKLASFAPFGIGNAKPMFLLQNSEIFNVKQIGKNAEHLKFSIKSDNKIFSAIGFRMSEHLTAIQNSKQLAVQLEKNEWQNRTELQIKLVDFA